VRPGGAAVTVALAVANEDPAALMTRQMGRRFLKSEGNEENRRLQFGLPQASGELQQDCDRTGIVICARRARDGVVMSADNVIGRSPRACRNRAKQIRHALVIVVIVLFTYSETSLLKDRVNVIGGSH